MKKNRFSVINESKFERLSKKELRESKGGICISCKRRTRRTQIDLRIWASGTFKL